MKMSKLILHAEKIAKYGVDAIALEIFDLLDKHSKNEEITENEKFILGLGYSEFYAENDSDLDYINAESKRRVILDGIGINSFELYKAIEKTYGRIVA